MCTLKNGNDKIDAFRESYANSRDIFEKYDNQGLCHTYFCRMLFLGCGFYLSIDSPLNLFPGTFRDVNK